MSDNPENELELLTDGPQGADWTLILALIVLRQRYWGRVGRLHYPLVGLVGVAFLGLLRYWNHLGKVMIHNNPYS